MRKKLISFGLIGMAALLSACATGPRFETSGVNTALTPAQAVAESEAVRGTSVLWGGVVVTSRNLENATQIEVLGYPLGRNQKPRIDEQPQRRFIILKQGYLETADYTQGRAVTVSGRLAGTQEGRVGEALYVYPVVEADRVYLWPRERYTTNEPRLHFGVGVIFGH